MNTIRASVGSCGWLVVLAGLCVVPVAASAQGPGGPAGADIKIRALNRDTSDTPPFCGTGGGLVGDRLAVDAFMDQDGNVTGTAVFEDANGVATEIDIDRLFSFGGGQIVQNQASQDTIVIWMNDENIPAAKSAIGVELPRGCSDNKSTFTPGLDKVTMQIKFRLRVPVDCDHRFQGNATRHSS